MKKKSANFIAYIAANKHTPYFDSAQGLTESSAIAQVKRQNFPDWKDCFIWAKPI